MRRYEMPVTGKAIKYLLIANAVVFLLQLLTGRALIYLGSLIPYHTFVGGQIWRTCTYMFLHSPVNFFHIIFNMFILWQFGLVIENIFGSRRFLLFYLICGVGSSLFSLFSLFDPVARFIPVIGASGAVIGVLTAYAYFFPHSKVLLFFVIPVNVKIVVIGYAIISFFGAFGAGGGTISHLTHLGGIVVAYIYLKIYPGFYNKRFHR